jgi:hypothetical protein
VPFRWGDRIRVVETKADEVDEDESKQTDQERRSRNSRMIRARKRK